MVFHRISNLQDLKDLIQNILEQHRNDPVDDIMREIDSEFRFYDVDDLIDWGHEREKILDDEISVLKDTIDELELEYESLEHDLQNSQDECDKCTFNCFHGFKQHMVLPPRWREFLFDLKTAVLQSINLKDK